jgi:CO/xanthine dehydrogenase FAD-binding subunit
VQIQNQGTIAGNLCNASPAADGVPPLMVLDAVVEVASVAGTRQVPLADFITGVRRVDLRPDEMVTAIHVPDLPESARSHFLKLGSRTYLVISIVMVAVLVRVDAGRIAEARIAVGSCAPVARRLPGLERALTGIEVAALEAVEFDMAGLSPISDVRGSAGYRHDSAAELCRRALRLACGGEALR